eukprot:COSAG01_NODE_10142_length_2237_cov_665.511693_4_plen_127_part_00
MGLALDIDPTLPFARTFGAARRVHRSACVQTEGTFAIEDEDEDTEADETADALMHGKKRRRKRRGKLKGLKVPMMALRKARQLVGQLFEQKIIADRVDDAKGNRCVVVAVQFGVSVGSSSRHVRVI